MPAHPIHAIAVADISSEDRILRIHNEGLVGLKWISIADTTVPRLDIGEEPSAIMEALVRSCAVMVRNHRAFAIGGTIPQALYKMLLLKDTCTIKVLTHSTGLIAADQTAQTKLKSRAEKLQCTLGIRHYWRYINPERLSPEIVARLEALGSDESRPRNAQLMPNSTESSTKVP